jgi:hypothetical protein
VWVNILHKGDSDDDDDNNDNDKSNCQGVSPEE